VLTSWPQDYVCLLGTPHFEKLSHPDIGLSGKQRGCEGFLGWNGRRFTSALIMLVMAPLLPASFGLGVGFGADGARQIVSGDGVEGSVHTCLDNSCCGALSPFWLQHGHRLGCSRTAPVVTVDGDGRRGLCFLTFTIFAFVVVSSLHTGFSAGIVFDEDGY
jgi:hypothetical protein